MPTRSLPPAVQEIPRVPGEAIHSYGPAGAQFRLLAEGRRTSARRRDGEFYARGGVVGRLVVCALERGISVVSLAPSRRFELGVFDGAPDQRVDVPELRQG